MVVATSEKIKRCYDERAEDLRDPIVGRLEIESIYHHRATRTFIVRCRVETRTGSRFLHPRLKAADLLSQQLFAEYLGDAFGAIVELPVAPSKWRAYVKRIAVCPTETAGSMPR